MSVSLVIFSIYLIIWKSYSELRICNSKNCLFKCSDGSCKGDTLICTNEVENCTIECNGYQSCRSLTPLQVYSGAKENTKIYCNQKDSCIGAKFFCGETLKAPININQLKGKHTQCDIYCGNVGCKNTHIYFGGDWRNGCNVHTTQFGSDNFKEAYLECELKKGNQPCSLYCNNYDSCDKSVFMCYGGKCKCYGNYCFERAKPNVQTPAPMTIPTMSPSTNTLLPTKHPSLNPTVSTNNPTLVPSKYPSKTTISPSNSPTTNYPTKTIFNRTINLTMASIIPNLEEKNVFSSLKIFENPILFYSIFGGFLMLCLMICCIVLTLKARYNKEDLSKKLIFLSDTNLKKDLKLEGNEVDYKSPNVNHNNISYGAIDGNNDMKKTSQNKKCINTDDINIEVINNFIAHQKGDPKILKKQKELYKYLQKRKENKKNTLNLDISECDFSNKSDNLVKPNLHSDVSHNSISTVHTSVTSGSDSNEEAFSSNPEEVETNL